jgi:hypothetical protein
MRPSEEDNTMPGNCNSPGCRCEYGHPDRPDPNDAAAVRDAEVRMLAEHIEATGAAYAAHQATQQAQPEAGS